MSNVNEVLIRLKDLSDSATELRVQILSRRPIASIEEDDLDWIRSDIDHLLLTEKMMNEIRS
jgi:hypothetical protein